MVNHLFRLGPSKNHGYVTVIASMHGRSAGVAALGLRRLRRLGLGHHVGRGQAQAMQRWLEGLGMSGALSCFDG